MKTCLIYHTDKDDHGRFENPQFIPLVGEGMHVPEGWFIVSTRDYRYTADELRIDINLSSPTRGEQ